jgi:hypothetical protein
MHFGYCKDQIKKNIATYASTDPRIRNYKVSSMRTCGNHLPISGPFLNPFTIGAMGQGGATGGGGFVPMVPGGGGTGWGMGGVSPMGQGTWGTAAPVPAVPTGFGGTWSGLQLLTVALDGYSTTEDLVQRFEQGLEVIKAW